MSPAPKIISNDLFNPSFVQVSDSRLDDKTLINAFSVLANQISQTRSIYPSSYFFAQTTAEVFRLQNRKREQRKIKKKRLSKITFAEWTWINLMKRIKLRIFNLCLTSNLFLQKICIVSKLNRINHCQFTKYK